MSRTKEERRAAKRLFKKPRGKFEKIDLNSISAPEWMTRAYKNNRYVVMISDNVEMTCGKTAIKAMIQKYDDRPIKNHWREIQNIKNEIFGREAIGIEYYPPESKLVDKANIYWLWIFKENDLPTEVKKIYPYSVVKK